MGDAFASHVLLPDLTLRTSPVFSNLSVQPSPLRSMLDGGESQTRWTAGARSRAGRGAGPPCVLVPVEKGREREREREREKKKMERPVGRLATLTPGRKNTRERERDKAR